jgi:transposase
MTAKKKVSSNLKVVEAKKAIESQETEVIERPVRRTFTANYKARIIKEMDAAPTGTIGSILRREGLYSSHIAKWRAEKARRGLAAQRRGPKPNPLTSEVQRLRSTNKRLGKQLMQANEIIELQKKISKLLGITLRESGEDD